jgi:hypothetical protein
MDEMVERVARAIYEEGLTRSRMGDHTYEAMLATARAAIAAMREPSAAMANSPDLWLGPDEITEQWRVMIDAALRD